MARLSTHVLDTARGVPASGLLIELYFGGSLISRATTNEDGRTKEPLLFADALIPGIYELIFHAGDYFRALPLILPNPPFFDDIVIRFGIADPQGSYHVPLLLSPYSYSTYRGS
jgi:5-hydroxyisourate hydrolase